VVLDERQPIEPFKAWRGGEARGNQAWLQINHPGRQVFAAMGQEAVAPSAIASTWALIRICFLCRARG